MTTASVEASDLPPYVSRAVPSVPAARPRAPRDEADDAAVVAQEARDQQTGPVTSLISATYPAFVATKGVTIFLGSTTRSNSSSLTNPSCSAAAFNERCLSIA